MHFPPFYPVFFLGEKEKGLFVPGSGWGLGIRRKLLNRAPVVTDATMKPHHRKFLLWLTNLSVRP